MTSLLTLALLAGCGPLGLLALDDWDKFALVWEDNFDFFDPNKWQHEVTATGGGNGEFQLYSQEPTNSYVKNGKLFIKPSLLVDTRNPKTGQPYGQQFMVNGVLDVRDLYGACTSEDNNGCYRTGAAGNIPPAMSARVRTFEKFSFTFGRVVISAKMPVGDWLWPAMWMLSENKEYGGWPRSGEIDIVEIIGNRDFNCSGGRRDISHMGCAMHWGTAWNQNRYYLSHRNKDDLARNYGDNFHTYVMDWSPNGLRMFVDDEDRSMMTIPNPQIDQNPNWVSFWEWGKPWPEGTENPWASGSNYAPFDKAFHFILNVAVGGTGGYIPDNCTNKGGASNMQKPWRNTESQNGAMRNFYNARSYWQPTWEVEGENNAMQIDYIRVYQGA
jgi:beta-glucanase (GH16 family)